MKTFEDVLQWFANNVFNEVAILRDAASDYAATARLEKVIDDVGEEPLR